MCPLYTHVTPILQCVGPCNLFESNWSMFVYSTLNCPVSSLSKVLTALLYIFSDTKKAQTYTTIVVCIQCFESNSVGMFIYIYDKGISKLSICVYLSTATRIFKYLTIPLYNRVCAFCIVVLYTRKGPNFTII